MAAETQVTAEVLVLLEALWLVAGVVGFGVSVFSVNDALQDHVTVERWTHVGTRTVIAKANLRREYTRSAIYLIFIIVGILSTQIPPPESVEMFRITVAVGLILVELLTVFNSIQDLRDRRVLYDRIAEQYQA